MGITASSPHEYTCTHITHIHVIHTHAQYGQTLTFCMKGGSKNCSRTSQKYTSWKSNSRISFFAHVCLHNLLCTWSIHRNVMFKLQSKIFVLVAFYTPYVIKVTIFMGDCLIQCVAPPLLLVFQEAPLAVTVGKHLQRRGWTTFSGPVNRAHPRLVSMTPSCGEWEDAWGEQHRVDQNMSITCK